MLLLILFDYIIEKKNPDEINEHFASYIRR